MSKPHEEKWANDDESEGWGGIDLVSTPQNVDAGDPDRLRVGEFDTPERRRLAAKAPEMARALLYKAGHRMDGGPQMNPCASCGQMPHDSACLFHLVLRDAGVLP